jgi:hypothetical protein
VDEVKIGEFIKVAPKPKGQGSVSQPTALPPTQPPPSVGADLGSWLLTANARTESALGRLEATLTAVQAQLTRIESKVEKVDGEVAGHGKWMHTLKVFAAALSALIIWIFVNAVWPWLKQKLGMSGASGQ